MTTATLILSQFSIIAYSLLGGVFLTFSDFMMRSLAATEQPRGGLEVMQVLNRKIYRSVFMVLFFAMLVLSPVLMFFAFQHWDHRSPWLIAGGALYVFGVFGLTAAGNVPMNQRLDQMPLDHPDTLEYWRTKYLTRWTLFNHIRTFNSVLAACLLLIGITQP